jgi:hypothetical protein
VRKVPVRHRRRIRRPCHPVGRYVVHPAQPHRESTPGGLGGCGLRGGRRSRRSPPNRVLGLRHDRVRRREGPVLVAAARARSPQDASTGVVSPPGGGRIEQRAGALRRHSERCGVAT